MHLGHAYAAWFAWHSGGGHMILRIEDIDRERCRPVYEAGILEDLAWLGLWSGGELHRQTDSLPAHQAAFARLQEAGLLYPCFCTRREILEQTARIASAPHGPDGPIYPGTCRTLPVGEAGELIAAGAPHVWRIDVLKAVVLVGALNWQDQEVGVAAAEPELFGDVVLARTFDQYSYHLCSVVDDAAQNVGLVTRGRDLFASTHIHRLLQALLDLPTPEYHHHPLVVDDHGVRLAKRADSLSLAHLRSQGLTPQEVLDEARRRLEP
jgi:glutamyl-Q tRNA(Asp) synthetase